MNEQFLTLKQNTHAAQVFLNTFGHTIGDVSLLDNLVSICYESQTDEKIKALLGVL